MRYYVEYTNLCGEPFGLLGLINPYWVSTSQGTSSYDASDVDLIVAKVEQLDSDDQTITISGRNKADEKYHYSDVTDGDFRKWLVNTLKRMNDVD